MTQTVHSTLANDTYPRVVMHIYSLVFETNHCGLRCIALHEALCNAVHSVTSVS
jgi:hypothetical protein